MKNTNLPLELLFEDVALTRKTGIHRVSMATIDTENYKSENKNVSTEGKDMGFDSFTPLKSEKKAHEVLKEEIEEVINRLDRGYSKLDMAAKIRVLEGLANQYKKDLEKENEGV